MAQLRSAEGNKSSKKFYRRSFAYKKSTMQVLKKRPVGLAPTGRCKAKAILDRHNLYYISGELIATAAS